MERSWHGLCLALTLAVAVTMVAPTAAAEKPLELTLESSVKLAFENNLAVAAATAQRASAVAKVEEARASVLPRVSGSGMYTRLSEPIMPLLDTSQDSFDFRISVTQPVYTGGALPAALRAAEASRKAAELEFESRRQEVAAQVASAYFGALVSDRLVNIAQLALANSEAHLAVVKAGFDAGTVLKTDLLRTEVAVGQARQNLVKASHGRELARIGLLTTLGLPEETPVRLTEPLGFAPREVSVSESLRAAYDRRPDLASTQTQLELGRAMIAQAKAGLLPSVALTATDNVSGGALDDLDNKWSVTLSASLNVFDWGAAKARLTQAEQNLKGLEMRVQGLMDAIRLEVYQATQAVIEARERVPLAEAGRRQAEENLAITIVRFQAGMATTVDVLDSQMLLTQSETSHIQAIYDHNLALARLAKATGENRF